MQNLEIKAELRDPALARTLLRAGGATFIMELSQTDTYYRVTHGRLKRREATGEPPEIIFYDRPNRASPKVSTFTIYSEDEAMERFGREALPVWLVVRKKRELWMEGSVRVHLDTVERLGNFLELEALVSKGHPLARCQEAIASMRERLRPAMGELIDRSYSDLLEHEQSLGLLDAPPALPPGS